MDFLSSGEMTDSLRIGWISHRIREIYSVSVAEC